MTPDSKVCRILSIVHYHLSILSKDVFENTNSFIRKMLANQVLQYMVNMLQTQWEVLFGWRANYAIRVR